MPSMNKTRGLASRTPLLALAIGATSAFFAADARAQALEQLKVPPPNLMLLLDTSNSMNKTLSGQDPDCVLPAGTYMSQYTPNPLDARGGSRWYQVANALTGSVPRAMCIPVTRDTVSFASEYSIANKLPYDATSLTKYYRTVSVNSLNQRCVLTPKYLPGAGPQLGVGVNNTAPTANPNLNNPSFMTGDPNYNPSGMYLGVYNRDAIRAVPTMTIGAGPTLEEVPFLAANATQECAYEVVDNGVLEYTKRFIRMGMMTYDNDTDNTSVSSAFTFGSGPGSAAYSYTPAAGPPDATYGAACTGYGAQTASSTVIPGGAMVCCYDQSSASAGTWQWGVRCTGASPTSTLPTASPGCVAFGQHCYTAGATRNACADNSLYSCCADMSWTNSTACQSGGGGGYNYAQYCAGGAAQCGLATNGSLFSPTTQGSANTVKGIDCTGINKTGSASSFVMDAANPFLGQWSYIPSNGPVFGNLPTCTPVWWEVGARHRAAPPWEGPHIPFPHWAATETDLLNQADNIKMAIRTVRPYGATPVAGQMRDAMDAMLVSPWGTNSRDFDPYLLGGCRKQYDIVLSDGDPNQDMRDDCVNDPDSASGGSNCMYGNSAGRCPFKKARKIAEDMYNGDSTQYGGASRGPKYSIKSYVIGFRASGGNVASPDGFPLPVIAAAAAGGATAPPSGKPDCSFWRLFANPTDPVNGNLAIACALTPPPKGTAAAACCNLDEIARYGSGGTGHAYFVNYQTELIAAFQAILDEITKGESTKTVPAYAPPQTSSDTSGNSTSVSSVFRAKFKPRLGYPWSGDVVRQRQSCDTTTGILTDNLNPTTGTGIIPQEGDDFAYNLANPTTWNKPKKFLVVSTTGAGNTDYGTAITTATKDGRVTLKPFGGNTFPTTSAFAWQTDTSGTTAVVEADGGSSVKLTPSSFEVSDNFCVSGFLTGGYAGTSSSPAAAAQLCSRVMWNFATAGFESIPFSSGGGDWNIRCNAQGTCSPIGGIHSSTPHIASPPDALVRDEGYQAYVSQFKSRERALYVHSIDGVLHAFRANYVNKLSTDPEDNRLFGFIPPAVIGDLKDTFPRGEKILLDGPIATKDVVFDRTTADLAKPERWHTALVASLGDGVGSRTGFYALEVTRPEMPSVTTYAAADCVKAGTGCTRPMEPATSTAARLAGPQFLWQITHADRHSSESDLAAEPPDPESGGCTPSNLNCAQAVHGRRRTAGGKSVRGDVAGLITQVQVFGDSSAKPAITTVLIRDSSGVNHEVGVAVVPHGGDSLVKDPSGNAYACRGPAYGGTCGGAGQPRCYGRAWGTPSGNSATGEKGFGDASISVTGVTANTAAARACTFRVPGRALSIIRLDTGEIVRTFARPWGPTPTNPAAVSNPYYDIPYQLQAKATHAPLRAPITGTPVVYPNEVGQVAQKAFVTDADGYLWRVDFTNPDPAGWRMKMFFDTQNGTVNSGLGTYSANGVSLSGPQAEANLSQEVNTPVLALDKRGKIVLNIATGDQFTYNDISPRRNFVHSITESLDSSGNAFAGDASSPAAAGQNYWLRLNAGERVTGPMTVFDNVHYFATYLPPGGTGGNGDTTKVCEQGHAYLFGRHFQNGNGNAGEGGAYSFPATGATGARTSPWSLEPFTGTQPAAGQVIPGVTILATQSCFTFDSVSDPAVGGSVLPRFTRPTKYSLFASLGTPSGGVTTYGGQSGDGSQLAPPQQRGTYFESWISSIQNL